MQQEILFELQRIVSEFCDEEIQLTKETDLAKDLGLDSVDLIDLLLTAGDRWRVQLEPSDLNTLSEPTRVLQLVEYIAKKRVMEGASDERE